VDKQFIHPACILMLLIIQNLHTRIYKVHIHSNRIYTSTYKVNIQSNRTYIKGYIK